MEVVRAIPAAGPAPRPDGTSGRASAARAALASLAPLDDAESRMSDDLVWAAGTGRDESDAEGLVTPAQAVRALEAWRALDEPARTTMGALLDQAKSPAERAVLLKGLAARRARADLDALGELMALAARIRGKPLHWLISKTTVYGLAEEPGWQQHWAASCGPAVQLVARAENDPFWALKLDDAMQDPAAIAEMERALLEGAGGEATELRDVHEPGDRGTWLLDYADQAIAGSGLQYELVTPRIDLLSTQRKPTSTDAELLETAIDEMEVAVRRGDDVPIGLTWPRDEDGTESGHYVLVVDVRQQGATRRWRIHDPWTGETRWHDDNWLRRGAERAHTLDEVFLPVPA